MAWQDKISETYHAFINAINNLYLLSGVFLISAALHAKSIADYLGLSDFAARYRSWIGLAFLCSSVFLILKVVGLIHSFYKGRIGLRLRDSRLRLLGDDEKAIFRRMLISNNKTIIMSMSGGIAGSFEAQYFWYRSSTISRRGDQFPYSIQPDVWKYLHDHLECVDLTADDLATRRARYQQSPRLLSMLSSRTIPTGAINPVTGLPMGSHGGFGGDGDSDGDDGEDQP
jgi:hypothetical protein